MPQRQPVSLKAQRSCGGGRSWPCCSHTQLRQLCAGWQEESPTTPLSVHGADVRASRQQVATVCRGSLIL